MDKSKADHIESIMEAVIELEMTKGHLKWRMADLSRLSGVTRSLLYYYFGKNTKSIFKEAVHYYIGQFLDFRIERAEKVRKGEIIELISVARKKLRKNPYFLQFYAKHRLEETDVSHLFQKAENHYFENLKETLPVRWRPLARILWALVFGLAIQPNLSDAELKSAEAVMRRAWPKRA
jgi:AcrR family transcriptional regulator